MARGAQATRWWLRSLCRRGRGCTVRVTGVQRFPNPNRVYRGAYCSMIMIALLALPTTLPSGATARAYEYESFSDGLPEYLSRCKKHDLSSE